jgi:hypothetical protein
MPVMNPEQEELEKMLEEFIKKIGLSTYEKDILRGGLKKGDFKTASKIVCQSLKGRDKYAIASKVNDMTPLFMPH